MFLWGNVASKSVSRTFPWHLVRTFRGAPMIRGVKQLYKLIHGNSDHSDGRMLKSSNSSNRIPAPRRKIPATWALWAPNRAKVSRFRSGGRQIGYPTRSQAAAAPQGVVESMASVGWAA